MRTLIGTAGQEFLATDRASGTGKHRLQPCAFPHHPADDIHFLRREFQRAISGIIADQCDHAGAAGVEPLDQQRIAHAHHMDPVAPGSLCAIDQDLVTVAQGRLHRITFDPDRRELRRIEALFAQPARAEAECADRQFLAREQAGTSRGAERKARHVDPFPTRSLSARRYYT